MAAVDVRVASAGRFRIAVIETQAFFGPALCALLESEASVAATGSLEMLDTLRLRRLMPDLILVDLDGLALDIADAMRQCRSAALHARVCVLATRPDRGIMRRCILAGADGYLVKDMAADDLIRAVKTVASGESYIDARVGDRDAEAIRRPVHALSPREREVLRLIARGFSNRDVGTQLTLSEKTVKNHLSSIFSKIGVATRTQAALHAVKEGYA